MANTSNFIPPSTKKKFDNAGKHRNGQCTPDMSIQFAGQKKHPSYLETIKVFPPRWKIFGSTLSKKKFFFQSDSADRMRHHESCVFHHNQKPLHAYSHSTRNLLTQRPHSSSNVGKTQTKLVSVFVWNKNAGVIFQCAAVPY